jgi:hypothetical protein
MKCLILGIMSLGMVAVVPEVKQPTTKIVLVGWHWPWVRAVTPVHVPTPVPKVVVVPTPAPVPTPAVKPELVPVPDVNQQEVKEEKQVAAIMNTLKDNRRKTVSSVCHDGVCEKLVEHHPILSNQVCSCGCGAQGCVCQNTPCISCATPICDAQLVYSQPYAVGRGCNGQRTVLHPLCGSKPIRRLFRGGCQ